MGDVTIGEPNRGVVLVNRAYLRGVQQVDPRTGERPSRCLVLRWAG